MNPLIYNTIRMSHSSSIISSVNSPAYTPVTLYGSNTSHCGYCNSVTGRSSYGIVCNIITPLVYQHMIDYNWRRSGDYIYKPDNIQGCCKQYTIRLDTNKFKPNKKQRNIWNRWNKYINGQQYNDNHHIQQKQQHNKKVKQQQQSNNQYQFIETILHNTLQQIIQDINNELHIIQSKYQQLIKSIKVYINKYNTNTDDSKVYLSSNIAIVVYNALIHVQDNSTTTTTSNNVEQVAQIIVNELTKHNDNIIQFDNTVKNGYINITVDKQYIAQQEAAINYKQQQHTNNTYNSTTQDSNMSTDQTKHKFTIEYKPAIYTDESYELYKLYQITIHHDPPNKITKNSYINFLCNSPIQSTKVNNMLTYNSYHVYYRLDNKLIAVGVIDILPYCLSSVYVFYDPVLSESYNLGTLTALYEIYYIRDTLQQYNNELIYYYMGYYIHTCQKMKYKGDYYPSQLLCIKRYTWHYLNDVIEYLNHNDLVIFSDIARTVDDIDNNTNTTQQQQHITAQQYKPNQQQLKQYFKTKKSDTIQYINTLRVMFNNNIYSITQLQGLLQQSKFVNSVLEFLSYIDQYTIQHIAISLD